MYVWLKDKLHWLWFYCLAKPWVNMTGCIWDRHRWRVLNVTNGTVSVWCSWCRAEREPTQAELEANPCYWYTPEQHAAQRAREEAIYEFLRKEGYTID